MDQKDIRTVIFDWDGTLHDTIHIYQPAFLAAMHYLESEGLIDKKNWTTETIKPFIGMSPTAMWASFEPALDSSVIEKASAIISKTMQHLIEDNRGKLYPDVIDTLAYLKAKGYDLIYLSNSKAYYMTLMRQHFQLDRFFDRFLCSEDFNYLPKQDILKAIKHELKPSLAMIGDRVIDIETGKQNGCLTIACDYGYGSSEELKYADIHLSKLREIKEYL